ncbi:hypothetical protein D3C85_1081930 [compost metagenome]
MAVSPHRLMEGRRHHIGLDQEQIELIGHSETADEGHHEGHDAYQQPPAQLDQVIHQGRARGLDLGLVPVERRH